MNATYLDLDSVRAVAPAAFTAHRAQHLSRNYVHVTTVKVLDALMQDGWRIIGADQGRVCAEEAELHKRHRVTLWHPDLPTHREGRPQMYLGNSSDGTSSFRTIGGFFRFACLNQCYVGVKVVGGVFNHRGGDLENRIVADARQLRARFDRVISRIDLWNRIELRDHELNQLQRKALALRWPTNPPVDISNRFGRPLRAEDEGRTLWKAYNRIQEYLVRGGFWATFKVAAKDGTIGRQVRTVRKITSLRTATRLNYGLWELGESFAK